VCSAGPLDAAQELLELHRIIMPEAVVSAPGSRRISPPDPLSGRPDLRAD
jgi:hypothetical protein